MAHNCFYKDQNCHHCGKQGHIKRVCCSKQQGKPKQATKDPEVHAVEVDVDVDAYLSHFRGTQCEETEQ